MKKLILLPALVLLTIFSVRGQNMQLNQKDLYKQRYGTWKLDIQSDTTFYVEILPAENLIQLTNYYAVNGKKHIMNTALIVFNEQKGVFEANRITSAGSVVKSKQWFTDPNTFHSESYNAEGKLLAKFEVVNKNPVQFVQTSYNADGIKSGENRFIKTSGILPPKPDPALNQTELAKKLIGTWLAPAENDTIQGLEFEQYGKAYLGSDIMIVKGQKRSTDKAIMAYSKTDNNWKMLLLFPGGGYITRVFYFVSENQGVQYTLSNLNQQKVTQSIVFEFTNPKTMQAKMYNLKGDMTEEVTFVKQ
jgi:hypothetical protein